MTRVGFAYVLRTYVRLAAPRCPSLAAKQVTPHVLRHTCALMILQATGDLRKVSLWLGHADMQTTEVYLRADPTDEWKGIVNLLPVDRINEHEGTQLPGESLLCDDGKARDVLPGVEPSPQLLTVCGGWEEVASRAEMLGDGTIRGEEPLRVSRRLEALQESLPLAGRLVGVFGAVIEILVSDDSCMGLLAWRFS
jgi:hypothetical protein